MAESSTGGGGGSGGAAKGKPERVVRVNAEDYSAEGKDFTSLKVICLGDSAVGKSK